MSKIARSFRLEDITLDRLKRLSYFYSLQSALSPENIPGQNKNVTMTDVIEFLINDKFNELMLKGEDIPE